MKKSNYNLKEAGTSRSAYNNTSAGWSSSNNPDADQILQSAISCGILPLDAVSNIENMIKRYEEIYSN